MKRNGLVKFQIFLLIVVVFGFLYWQFWGTPEREGIVVFEKLEQNNLYQKTLTFDEKTQIKINVRGALENKDLLATYGWILDEENDEIVWEMKATQASKIKGSLVEIEKYLTLNPGTYTFFYTTFGDSDIPASGNRPWFSFWNDDARTWHATIDDWFFQVRLVNSQDLTHVREVEDQFERSEQNNRIVWEITQASSYTFDSYTFSLSKPTKFHIRALGEFSDYGSDLGWIESLNTGEKVWEMKNQNTKHAGGSVRNKLFDGIITLPAGMYQANYESDYEHGYDNWKTNPPLHPKHWGMLLEVQDPADKANIGQVNLWELPKLVDLTAAPNGVSWSQQFEISHVARVYINAIGEKMSGHYYDKGWIANTQSGEHVWSFENSDDKAAGGDSKNSLHESYIDLEPGSYTAFFETDDSHAFNDWNATPPDHPERYGLTVILMDTTVTYKTYNKQGPLQNSAIISTDYTDVALLADISRVGNNANEEKTIVLQKDSHLHIYAMGEYIRGWYDYGYIVSAASGDKVWEMNFNDTRAAGGDDKNRVYDGLIQLPAGTYYVKYESDGSHSFSDFNGEGPTDGAGWGIKVWEAKLAE